MEEMNQLKVFTVEEANRLLPKLTQLLGELQGRRDVIHAMEVEIDAIELVADKDESGSAPALSRKVEEYNQTVQRFYEAIDEIHELGCFLKDIEGGLIDFYGLHQGRVVYLCWKLGEPEVGYWHEVGRGFAYRQPVDFDSDQRESSG